MAKEYNNQTIIPVIATFDTDGNVKPLFVRIKGEEYKILSSWMNPEDSFSGIKNNILVFRCKIEVRGYAREIKITFWGNERVWTIPSDIQ